MPSNVYGLETRESEGLRMGDVVDFVAVHGLNDTDDVWEPLNESSWGYLEWFDGRIDNARTSVYRYPVLDLQANVFLREGLRHAAVLLLEAVRALRRERGSKIVFIAHDFGVSCPEDVSERIFDRSDVTMTLTSSQNLYQEFSSLSHRDITRQLNTETGRKVKSFLALDTSFESSQKPKLHALNDPETSEQQLSFLQDATFLEWISASRTALLFIPQSSQRENIGSRLRDFLTISPKSSETWSRRVVQLFEFNAWDCRSNTVESMFTTFLAELSDKINNLLGSTEVSNFFDKYPRWNLQDLFFFFYGVLLASECPEIIWVLVNFDDRIKYHRWLCEKLEALSTNSELNFKVAFLSNGITRLAIGGAHMQKLDTLGGPSTVLPVTGYGSHDKPVTQPPTSTFDSNTLELILGNHQLYTVAPELAHLLATSTFDPELHQMVLAWISSWGIDIETPDLNRVFRELSPLSVKGVFGQVLRSAIAVSGEPQPSVANATLELIALSFRPFTTHELTDLEDTCRWRAGEGRRSKQIISWLPGVLAIRGSEVHFSHHLLRDFIFSERDYASINGNSQDTAPAHQRIASLCLKYLMSARGRQHLARYELEDYGDVPPPESQLNFFLYAVKFWPKHAKLAWPSLSLEPEPIWRFLADRKILDIWAKAYWSHCSSFIRPSSDRATPFAVFAEHGMEQLLAQMITLYKDNSCHHQECFTALTAAAWSGEYGAIQILLKIPIPEGKTLDEAILASLESENEEATKYLLSTALKSSGSFKDPLTALCRATFNNRMTAAAFMLRNFPAIREEFEKQTKLIEIVCMQGSLETLKLFLDETKTIVDSFALSVAVYAATKYSNHNSAIFLLKQVHQRLLPDDQIDSEGIEDNNGNVKSNAKPYCEDQPKSRPSEYREDMIFEELGRIDDTLESRRAPMQLMNHATSFPDILANTMKNLVQWGGHRILRSLLKIMEEDPESTARAVPLINIAIRHGKPECLKILLDSSPDSITTISIKDLISTAVLQKQSKCLRILFDMLARPGAPDAMLRDISFTGHLREAVIIDDRESLEILVDEARKVVPEDVFIEAITEELGVAIDGQHLKAAKALIQARPDLEKKTIRGTRTPLYQAAFEGYVELVECLLEAKADPNVPEDDDDDAWKPIHAAYDNAECLKLLLQAGAEIDAKTGAGRTALHLARYLESSVKELLKWKPDPNFVCENVSYLSFAVKEGYTAIAMMLLDAGADPCHPITKEANRYLLHECVKKNYEDLLRRLLLFNIQVDETDELGRTALNSLDSVTGMAILQLLINRGASVNTADDFKDTPLAKAIYYGDVQKAEFLISRGANVNAHVKDATPLYLACAWSSLDMIKMLVDKDANINFVDQGQNGTVFQAACRREDSDRPGILAYLLNTSKATARQSSDWWGSNLHTACLLADIDIVRSLIESGAYINSDDRVGRRPIHNALYRTLEFVELLYENGATLFVEDKMQRNALHFAVVSGRLDVVKYIIGKRKDLVNEVDCHGWTPLFWAVRRCNLWGTKESERGAIIKELKIQGADIMARSEGLDRVWTAYKVAKYYGLPEEITELLGSPSELESSREGKTYDGWFCDACNMEAVGLYYTCVECVTFLLCFKCYHSRDVVHPKHGFTAANEGDEYVSSDMDGESTDPEQSDFDVVGDDEVMDDVQETAHDGGEQESVLSYGSGESRRSTMAED
ncbi:Nn.00g017030.m01.CDS01 [Neocucurbitaria sp. VM-36]